MGFPAIVPGTISVTGDRRQRPARLRRPAARDRRQGGASATTIAAPGVGITAPSGDNGTTTEDGTSFAAPQVTGSVVLLQQMYEKAYRHPARPSPELDQLAPARRGHRPRRRHRDRRRPARRPQLAPRSSSQQIATPRTPDSRPPTPTPASPRRRRRRPRPRRPTPTPDGRSPGGRPQTQVFVNGVSIGQLLDGPARREVSQPLRVPQRVRCRASDLGPAGSKVNLGPSTALGRGDASPTRTVKTPGDAGRQGPREPRPPRPSPAVHHAAAHKYSPSRHSLLSYLFPFKI